MLASAAVSLQPQNNIKEQLMINIMAHSADQTSTQSLIVSLNKDQLCMAPELVHRSGRPWLVFLTRDRLPRCMAVLTFDPADRDDANQL